VFGKSFIYCRTRGEERFPHCLPALFQAVQETIPSIVVAIVIAIVIYKNVKKQGYTEIKMGRKEQQIKKTFLNQGISLYFSISPLFSQVYWYLILFIENENADLLPNIKSSPCSDM
jgi:hypothetical protein